MHQVGAEGSLPGIVLAMNKEKKSFLIRPF